MRTSTIKVLFVKESIISGYDAYIETKSGKRYYINWATEPTEQEVVEAWNTDRKFFIHIN